MRERIPLATERRPLSRGEVYPALLLSGCKDVEFSYDADFGGRPNGAMTRAALEGLAESEHAAGVVQGDPKAPAVAEYPSPQLFGGTKAKRGRCSEPWATKAMPLGSTSRRHGQRRPVEGSPRGRVAAGAAGAPKGAEPGFTISEYLPRHMSCGPTSGARPTRSTVRCASSPSTPPCRSSRVPWRCSTCRTSRSGPAPAGGCSMWSGGAEDPVCDLEDRQALILQGFAPSRSDSRFQQQMVYAVCSSVYASFKAALGRDPVWGFERDEDDDGIGRGALILRPRAFPGRNAYYSKVEGALNFGYFTAEATAGGFMQGEEIFTCLSHDVVAHELTHALLDGLRSHFAIPTQVDVLAFHEAFADLVAVFQHFSYREVVLAAIQKSRGEVTEGLLTDLARPLGVSTGRASPLRRAVDAPDKDRLRYDPTLEVHELGSVLVLAVFDAFNTVYRRKTARYVRLATGGTGHWLWASSRRIFRPCSRRRRVSSRASSCRSASGRSTTARPSIWSSASSCAPSSRRTASSCPTTRGAIARPGSMHFTLAASGRRA